MLTSLPKVRYPFRPHLQTETASALRGSWELRPLWLRNGGESNRRWSVIGWASPVLGPLVNIAPAFFMHMLYVL